MLFELRFGVANSTDYVPEGIRDKSVSVELLQEVQPVALFLSVFQIHRGLLVFDLKALSVGLINVWQLILFHQILIFLNGLVQLALFSIGFPLLNHFEVDLGLV